jgi:hypothetical protein
MSIQGWPSAKPAIIADSLYEKWLKFYLHLNVSMAKTTAIATVTTLDLTPAPWAAQQQPLSHSLKDSRCQLRFRIGISQM